MSHSQVFHDDEINLILLNIFSFKFVKTDDFYQQRLRSFTKVIIQFLCLRQQNLSFLSLYCLKDKFMVKSAEKKLSTFPSLGKRFLLN